MDILVPITMKNAAKCDTQCELQNSASHQIFERIPRFGDIPLPCLFQCVKLTSYILMRLRSHSLVENEFMRCLPLTKWSHINVISSEPRDHLHKWITNRHLQSSSEIKQEHPLNLSISVSGGKETNKDYLSSGEWTGKSSHWKSLTRIVIYRIL
jgi:hypothetical protein